MNIEQLKLKLESVLTSYNISGELQEDIITDYMSMISDVSSKHVTIKIVNTSDNELPEYATDGSSGMDIKANITNEHKQLIIEPGGRCLIPTGIFAEIPIGYEIQVRGRSGLALKKGITIMQGIATIDSDYRGEIGVILYNSSKEHVAISHGDRIAQLVIAKVEKAVLKKVQGLQQTIRGDGGFGSTGN